MLLKTNFTPFGRNKFILVLPGPACAEVKLIHPNPDTSRSFSDLPLPSKVTSIECFSNTTYVKSESSTGKRMLLYCLIKTSFALYVFVTWNAMFGEVNTAKFTAVPSY